MVTILQGIPQEEAEACGLVLLSAGIVYRSEKRPDGWTIRVAPQRAAEAQDLVRQYREENSVVGGFGDAVLELLSSKNAPNRVTRLGIPDRFVPHGGRNELLDEVGLSSAKIARAVFDTVQSRTST